MKRDRFLTAVLDPRRPEEALALARDAGLVDVSYRPEQRGVTKALMESVLASPAVVKKDGEVDAATFNARFAAEVFVATLPAAERALVRPALAALQPLLDHCASIAFGGGYAAGASAGWRQGHRAAANGVPPIVLAAPEPPPTPAPQPIDIAPLAEAVRELATTSTEANDGLVRALGAIQGQLTALGIASAPTVERKTVTKFERSTMGDVTKAESVTEERPVNDE